MRTSAAAIADAGFSLVEVLMALVVLGVIVAMLGSVLGGIWQTDAMQQEQATELLQSGNQGDLEMVGSPGSIPAGR